MRYELWYAEERSASFDPSVKISERKTEIIEANSYDAAEREAAKFLAGRKIISLRSLYLPEPDAVLKPGTGLIPEDELNERF